MVVVAVVRVAVVVTVVKVVGAVVVVVVVRAEVVRHLLWKRQLCLIHAKY